MFVEISLPAWACDLQRLLTRDHSHGVSIPPMWKLADYRVELGVEIVVSHGLEMVPRPAPTFQATKDFRMS